MEETPLTVGVGDNCGASYLNDNYRNLLERRIEHEHYLFTNGETKESIVNRLIPTFEDDFKRRIDVTKPCGTKIYIANLIGDDQRMPPGGRKRRFEPNKLVLNQ